MTYNISSYADLKTVIRVSLLSPGLAEFSDANFGSVSYFAQNLLVGLVVMMIGRKLKQIVSLPTPQGNNVSLI